MITLLRSIPILSVIISILYQLFTIHYLLVRPPALSFFQIYLELSEILPISELKLEITHVRNFSKNIWKFTHLFVILQTKST